MRRFLRHCPPPARPGRPHLRWRGTVPFGLAAPVAVAVAIALAGPAPLHAQAVCSAPHSAPVVGPSGSMGTLEAGAGWAQAAFRGTRSVRFYGTGGNEHRLPGDAEATTVSMYVTGAVGVARGLELWAQMPVHRLRFDQVGNSRTRTGLGDPRLSVRVASDLFGLDPLPLSVRAGVKFAGSDFPVDPRILPLTEGQTDYEVALEAGTSLGEGSYLMGWVGYRWRTEDHATGREPGDERFAHLAIGRAVGRFRFVLGADALDGLGPIDNGVHVPVSARRLFQVNPTVGWEAGPGRLEVGAQIPLSGRNLPVGPALSTSYLVPWGGM